MILFFFSFFFFLLAAVDVELFSKPGERKMAVRTVCGPSEGNVWVSNKVGGIYFEINELQINDCQRKLQFCFIS